ncbi:probable Zinc-regulated transporter 1 [Zygosaccharomyces bailii]|nr:probable Zinc-regulated transporter 1 [Zygosaccharomyces bailii]
MSSPVQPWWKQWNPDNVTIGNENVPDSWKYCTLQGVYFGGNEYNGSLGARISSIFVILGVSTACTLFPVVSKHVRWLRIHKYVYLFARSFGTGVIIATAYIHLMDPAYSEIGGLSCVGQTGNWAIYSWCPAIMLATVVLTFLVDLFCGVYVERKYRIKHNENEDHIMHAVVAREPRDDSHEHARGDEPIEAVISNDGGIPLPEMNSEDKKDELERHISVDSTVDSLEREISFKSEFAAFLVLEFGILFHSVMIGLNLGTTGDEFPTLYPVLVFHQSFEGLGIGARLSAIDFPHNKRWWPYILCVAYGLTTPVCVAIGLGVKTSYSGNSYAVNVVSGVLDSISAGVLMYTGLVELLAKDFVFNPHRSDSLRELFFNIFFMLWGAGLMALLGKWA